jgi:hypothetical protein
VSTSPDIIGICKEYLEKYQDKEKVSNERIEALSLRHCPAFAQAFLIAVDHLHKIECCDFMDDDGFRKPTTEAKIACNALARIRSLPS